MSRRWKIVAWIVGGTVLTIVLVLIIAAVEISRHAGSLTSSWMSQEYNSRVEIASFRVTVPFPQVQCEAENMVLHFQGRQDLPPLITIKRFTLRTSLWGMIRRSPRIEYLQLDGLQMNIPPRDSTSAGNTRRFTSKLRNVRFDQIVAENAVLRVLNRNPDKDPLEFDVQDLRLTSSATDGALDFVAKLSNPKPPGEILSTGSFGPWNSETPSLTPVSGKYNFEKADLGVFPGISGTLASNGKYQGVLEKLLVNGTTDTPDFRVTRSAGHSVDLRTTFHATVNGTDGDTYLQPVEAHFGQTVLIAQGSVEGVKGKKGKVVTLDVTSDHARIEDLLTLAVGGSASMTGPIRLKTQFALAPGPKEIPDRLNLNGSFELDSVHFTNSTMQQKIDNMSKRSQGKPREIVNPQQAISSDDVTTAMKGDFRLADGILSFPGFNFEIPGTDLHLAGTYALDPQILNLHGKLILQAKLSQTTTGIKSVLLKLADPLFSKQGNGTVLPIKITGPVQHPHYGLEFGRKSEAPPDTP